MKNLFILTYSLLFLDCHAQFQDNFADSNFTVNPFWTGDSINFEITPNHVLRLKAPSITGTSILSTPSSALINGSWEFDVSMDFNPSSSNYCQVYLVSDKVDLTAPLNGYFVEIGKTNDEVSLYAQFGNDRIKLIDGQDKLVDSNPVEISIRVLRKKSAEWELFTKPKGSTVYTSEGTSINDSILSATFFGISCSYTSSRSDKFYFDNFLVTGTKFIDTIPPKLKNIEVKNTTTLLLKFNEPLDSNTSIINTNFNINYDIGTPVIANVYQKNSILLEYSIPFSENILHELTITGVKDIAGNTIIPVTTTFKLTVYASANRGDVIINELFPDPTPSNGLPESEFIELFNRSGKIINLDKWKLADPTKTAQIGRTIFSPEEYVIICAVDDSSQFTGYGKTIALPGLPSLNNADDIIWLEDSNGTVIDLVHYNNNWYGNEEKSAGGWSLEKKNPGNSCNNEFSWLASNAISGGSPGKRNSIYVREDDTTFPFITNVAVLDNTSLLLYISKVIDTMSINLSNFIVNQSIQIERIDYLSASVLQLNLSDSLLPATDHQITMFNVYDCLGNQTEVDSFQFIVPDKGEAGDIVINEVLFNPRIGGVDFVEIYNRSLKYIGLRNWKIANYDEQKDTVFKPAFITTDPYIIPPLTYMVLTSDSNNVIYEYPSGNKQTFIQFKLPSYSNDKGSVILINPEENIVDRFDYNENMHFALLNDTKGVSLERVHYDRATEDATNWHSAAQNAGFATPGYINSQFNENRHTSGHISLFPEIFSPDNDGFDDVLNLEYHFPMEGYTGSITVYDKVGRPVKYLARNQTFSTSGIISWDGINEQGLIPGIGIYVVHVEAFHLNGTLETSRLVCVLAGKLK